jgi:hypothetical protein
VLHLGDVSLKDVVAYCYYHHLDTVMAQEVSRWPPTAEALVRVPVSLCGTCGQVAMEQGFLRGLRCSPASIIPLWISILICNVKGEQWAPWWSQFRDNLTPST